MSELDAKGEVQRLMNELLQVAKRMLKEYGEFYPYGGYMKDNGEIVHVSAKGSSDKPKSKELLDILHADFRNLAANGTCRATAIIFNVKITPPGESEKKDAVQANLAHMHGYSAEVFFPYKISSPGQVEFGKTFAQRGLNDIFEN